MMMLMVMLMLLTTVMAHDDDDVYYYDVGDVLVQTHTSELQLYDMCRYVGLAR